MPPESLYPLDIDRVSKALDRIKPQISNWVDQTPQTLTLVETGQVDFSYTYATRVKAAQKSSKPINFSFKQNLLRVRVPSFFGYPHRTDRETVHSLIPRSTAPRRRSASSVSSTTTANTIRNTAAARIGGDKCSRRPFHI
jgi:hypothetical protein